MDLRRLCPTRWTVRTASLQSVCTNYSVIQRTLLTTAKMMPAPKQRDCCAEWSLLRCFFSINLALIVFQPAEDCSKIVQSKTISAVAAKKAATTTVQMLQSLRDDVKFYELYDDCVRTAASLNIDEPKLGRKSPTTAVPWRQISWTSPFGAHTRRTTFQKLPLPISQTHTDNKFFDIDTWHIGCVWNLSGSWLKLCWLTVGCILHLFW